MNSALETFAEITRPMRFIGEGPIGDFLFSDRFPFCTHHASTLEAAVEEFGFRIVVEGDSITSPRFHAGYNSGLFGKRFDPCTRISDGAPRQLTYAERNEYINGFLHGLITAREIEAHRK